MASENKEFDFNRLLETTQGVKEDFEDVPFDEEADLGQSEESNRKVIAARVISVFREKVSKTKDTIKAVNAAANSANISFNDAVEILLDLVPREEGEKSRSVWVPSDKSPNDKRVD